MYALIDLRPNVFLANQFYAALSIFSTPKPGRGGGGGGGGGLSHPPPRRFSDIEGFKALQKAFARRSMFRPGTKTKLVKKPAYFGLRIGRRFKKRASPYIP